MNTYSINFSNDYLSHHGILGQKWGKKNGPPYPLDAEDHSASEKKSDWKKSLRTKRLESANRAARRDADDLRNHGYNSEAKAVEDVANKREKKIEKSIEKDKAKADKKQGKQLVKQYDRILTQEYMNAGKELYKTLYTSPKKYYEKVTEMEYSAYKKAVDQYIKEYGDIRIGTLNYAASRDASFNYAHKRNNSK